MFDDCDFLFPLQLSDILIEFLYKVEMETATSLRESGQEGEVEEAN
jgi:hypothetical protein